MAILAVLLIIVGTIMMAMSQKAGAMAAQVRKGTIHAVLCQNLASGSARGYCGVGFVRRHPSCLSQPAVAGPMPFLATVVAHVSLLGLALGTCRGTLFRLVLLVPLVGFVSSFTFAFSFVSFALSFVSFALLPFFAFSFVTLVALPGTKRVEVPVVVLLLEGKNTKLLVVELELQALQHCIQTTGGLMQQEVPFSVLVQVLQDS